VPRRERFRGSTRHTSRRRKRGHTKQHHVFFVDARNNAEKTNTINNKLMPICNQLTEQKPQKFFLIS